MRTHRLPGTCRRCGQRVEARLPGQAETIEIVTNPWGGPRQRLTRDLPAGWCDPGSWDDHQCGRLDDYLAEP